MDLHLEREEDAPVLAPMVQRRRFKEGRLLFLLKELEKRRLVTSYATLVEASGKPVAQFEHTMAIDDGGLVILT